MRIKTRPYTRKGSHGPLGRGCNAKTARNEKKHGWMDGWAHRWMDRWTDGRGVVACPQLKNAMDGPKDGQTTPLMESLCQRLKKGALFRLASLI